MRLITNNLLAALLFLSPAAQSQASLDSLLANVMLHNRSISGAMQYLKKVRIASRTNLYPENPELEFGRLWSSPSDMGNRTDFEISQSFDFPAIYLNRNRLSKAGVDRAINTAEGIRQEILLHAKRLWIEKVHLNRKMNVLRNRLVLADKVENFLRKQFEEGEISKIRYNKAVFVKASLFSEMDILVAESAALDTEIARIAGHQVPTIIDTIYYPADRAELDRLLAISATEPRYLALQKNEEVLVLQKRLIKSSSLPKFKTAYYSESVPGLQMRGVKVGLSIPLWENSGMTKAAEADIISAELASDKYRSDQVAVIMQTHIRFKSYQEKTAGLSHALDQANDPALLAFAVENGEISLVEYFYETELYFRVFNELLETEKAMYLAEAELSRYEL